MHLMACNYFSVQFSHSVMSDSLQPHELQHARPPCPSPTPKVHPNPCPLSRWCHPTISSSVAPFSSHLQSYPASGSFSNESALRIRWPKYWSFSFSISSVQSLSHVRLFATPWIAACQASLSIINSWSSLRLTFIKSVMPSSHLILRRPLLLLPPIPPSIRVFSNSSL